MALLNLLISISSSILFHKLSPALGVNEKKLILQLLDLIKTTVAWNASQVGLPNRVNVVSKQPSDLLAMEGLHHQRRRRSVLRMIK